MCGDIFFSLSSLVCGAYPVGWGDAKCPVAHRTDSTGEGFSVPGGNNAGVQKFQCRHRRRSLPAKEAMGK